MLDTYSPRTRPVPPHPRYVPTHVPTLPVTVGRVGNCDWHKFRNHSNVPFATYGFSTRERPISEHCRGEFGQAGSCVLGQAARICRKARTTLHSEFLPPKAFASTKVCWPAPEASLRNCLFSQVLRVIIAHLDTDYRLQPPDKHSPAPLVPDCSGSSVLTKVPWR